jgi:hypothetical protein
MLQTTNRDIPECGPGDTKDEYQRHEHDPLDVLQFTLDEGSENEIPSDTLYPASARIYCPDIRVVSRIGVIFEPLNPNDKSLYNLATLNNTIVAYRCMNAKTRIARVGEIVGKNGVPLVFPKSDIDGIAFQNDDDMPWIDIVLNLGFPGVPGTWVLYYHATSNNKLKVREWQGYISRVTMVLQSSPGLVRYSIGGRGEE